MRIKLRSLLYMLSFFFGMVTLYIPMPAFADPIDPAPNCIGEPDDHPVVDYPEQRVFLESQGWWGERDENGNVPQFGDAEHLHVGACFPLQQTVSGTVRMDFRVVAHNVPQGSLIRQTRFHDADNEGTSIPPVIINWNYVISNSPPSNVVVWEEDVEIDTLDFQDGLREARPFTILERPDGAEIHVSGGWCWNIQNTPGTADDPDPRPLCGYGQTQGRGWYDCFEYKLAHTGAWEYPYDGVPPAHDYKLYTHFRDGASGTTEVSGHFARLNPRFHMNDQGLILFNHPDPHSADLLTTPGSAFTLDAEGGPREHALFLMTFEDGECTDSPDPDQIVPQDGQISGGIRIPILVNPRTPVSLDVDSSAVSSDGNGVFEPGERVRVTPAWRNDGFAPIALDGTASDFDGPNGATYTISVGNAGFGTVAPGATASCLDAGDCYQLKLSSPSTRPQIHWDADFVETLSEGTKKRRSLHIGESFMDVSRAHLFYPLVETVFHHGIMGGCGGTQFCPREIIDRGDMAEFMVKAKLNPFDYTVDCTQGDEVFDDVPATHPQCKWIERLWRMGVTSGCGGGKYCPNDSVTRGQMAVLLLKTALYPSYTPPPCIGIFTDASCSSTFADWIEDAYARGITAGCGSTPLKYCPAAVLNRAQMAAFISKAFALGLYP